jgi:small-conductance mechanosensitive channel
MFGPNMDLAFIITLLQIVTIGVVAFVLVRTLRRVMNAFEEQKKIKRGILSNLERFLQLVTYATATILILSMLNVDVTGLVASLGLGALIIGFALKEIIENWVSGLLIVSGKTYRIGDLVAVGNLKGMVVDISLRTTKLRTYDRNEVIIPNSLLLRDRVVNFTSGKQETVSSIFSVIDYIFDVEKAKLAVERVLVKHPKVVIDPNRRREIRFVVRHKEWTTEIECLFWINNPANEEFIKSEINQLVKKELQSEGILPPIPAFLRKEFLDKER